MELQKYKKIELLLSDFRNNSDLLLRATKEWRGGNKTKKVKDMLLVFMGEDEIDDIAI